MKNPIKVWTLIVCFTVACLTLAVSPSLLIFGCSPSRKATSLDNTNSGPPVSLPPLRPDPGTYTNCTWGDDNTIVGPANLRKQLRIKQAVGTVWCDEPPNGFDANGIPRPFKRQLPDGTWVTVGANIGLTP